ncbi:hypothetical protein [Thiogranum longum]|uniref:hypothetical protein n=1 Tax=Thiogranum longum TaxID=1537524 RepID=UPI001A9F1A45|nr:hypothetical protein [Thiogranum longum]
MPDTLPGKAFGGLAGFMVGAAVGGPVGAIGVGFASVWLGGNVQETTGLHGRAYRIKSHDGTIRIVRSPQQQWSIGDQVQVDDNRLAYLEKQQVSRSK